MTLEPNLADRFSRLLAVRLAERAEQFEVELRQLTAEASRRGMINSGWHVSRIHQLHASELQIRSIIAWESLVRSHKSLGSNLPEGGIATAFKTELRRQINSISSGLSVSLQRQMKRFQPSATLDLV